VSYAPCLARRARLPTHKAKESRQWGCHGLLFSAVSIECLPPRREHPAARLDR